MSNGDDVLFAVPVDVGQRHGVADFAHFGIERLGLELRKLRRAGRETRKPQCRAGNRHRQLFSHVYLFRKPYRDR